jgi:thiaminase/transcriptional activator TenA
MGFCIYSKQYAELLKIIRDVIDSSPKNIDEVKKVFELSLRYEYLFWDYAYKMERWPI